jgi:pyruvate-formate lyase
MNTGWADSSAGLFMLGYHFTPPWEKILGSGLKVFEEEVQAKLSSLDYANPEDMGKEHFLKALLIICAAIKNFARRYSKEAERLAALTKDEKRRQELLKIAENCQRVPYRSARNFYEAIQSVWFMHMMVYLEGTGPSTAWAGSTSTCTRFIKPTCRTAR